MHRVELLRRRALRVIWGHAFVTGSVAVRAPVPLVLPRVAVEHDDAPIAVSVADIDLVGRGVIPDLGGLPQVLGVVAAVVDAVFTDLKQKLAGAVELQDLRVHLTIPRQPHVAATIDGDAVVAVRPVVAGAGPAPGPDEIAGLIVDEHRWRHLAAGADRRRRRGL